MVFSAAIKGVPDSLIEAAKVDGATDRQAFYKVTLPYIRSTIVTVATTTTIGGLKAFDIVATTTGGRFGTSTIANEFYVTKFVQGRGRSRFRAGGDDLHPGHPRRGVEPTGPEASTGDDGRMTTVTPTDIASGAPPATKKRKFREPIGRSTSATLSSRPGRIIVYTLMFLWTLPTFGILVSSFRPEIEVKTSGWWNWFRDPSFTLKNYDRVLSSAPGDDNIGKFFLNSLRITVPSVILSVGIALLAVVRVLVDEVQGSGLALRRRRRAADGAAPDGADSDAPALHAVGPTSAR